MSFNYEYHEQLIKFFTLDFVHNDIQLLTELINFFIFFEIKDKLFEMIIINASNNITLKKEFKEL